jgi:hypothetical protein
MFCKHVFIAAGTSPTAFACGFRTQAEFKSLISIHYIGIIKVRLVTEVTKHVFDPA